MGLIGISGEPGCRTEEIARMIARRLDFTLITEPRLLALAGEEFIGKTSIPAKAYPPLFASLLAGIAAQQHLVVALDGVETLAKYFPGMLRIHLMASLARRIGNLMVDQKLDRNTAKELLKNLDGEQRSTRKERFGRTAPAPSSFDLLLNVEEFEPEAALDLIEAAAKARQISEQPYLSAAAETQLQFQFRLKLAQHGIAPPSSVQIEKSRFANASEQVFANLLDFYRISWEYEPRSFPLKWDNNGKVLEAFTPDFYLPEADLYIELTTMKQSLVTKKNRKVKLLKAIYPHINIQVFYQKDFQNLVFKHGLAERLTNA